MSDRQDGFWLVYSIYCIRAKVCPLKSIIRHLQGTELCIPVEAIRPEHWLFVLSALCNDNSLTKVHFASCISPHGNNNCVNTKRNKRDKGFPTPYGRTEENVTNICLSLAGLLHSSQCLTVLKLENLSLKIFDAQQLSAGLADAPLKVMSLSGCKFEKGAVEIICRGLNMTYVSWLDLSSCALTLSEIEAVCTLINAHGVRRSNQMFPETLRYNFANLSEMNGLNRVSLNNNLLETLSILLLAESMVDDFWMKAIDLQNCGIDDEGAEALLKLASTKCELEIIDLRLNDIEEDLLHRIEQQLIINRAGKTSKYQPAPLWKPSEMVRKYNTVRKVKVPKKMPSYKFRILKKASKSCDHSSVKSPYTMRTKVSSVKDVAVQTSFEMTKEVPKAVQALFCEIRNKLEYETKLRKFVVRKYNQVHAEHFQLREMMKNQADDILIDQETYFEIKNTFEKLKIFFDVMKKYELWEYISMLGFDEISDVMVTENDSMKHMTITRKEASACNQGRKCKLEDKEPCCNCRKMEAKHKHVESSNLPPEEVVSSIAAANAKAAHDKYVLESIKEYFLKENGPYRLLKEVMNDYNNTSNQPTNKKSVPGRQTSATNMPQENAKASSSKQPHSLLPKTASGTHMVVKKFSYSNMPKQLKELVTPADFYKIVKRELERCESEAAKPFVSSHESTSRTSSITRMPSEKPIRIDLSDLEAHTVYQKDLERCEREARKQFAAAFIKNSSQTSSSAPTSASQIQSEKYIPVNIFEADAARKLCKKDREVHEIDAGDPFTSALAKNASPVQSEVYVPANVFEKKSLNPPISKKDSTPKYPSAMYSNDEDYENITISELIAREKALMASKQDQASPKYIPTKKEPAKSSVSSSLKTHRSSNHTKSKETLVKSEQKEPPHSVAVGRLSERVLPKSKLKLSSSQMNSKKVQARSNASSDEINSSDSIVTASDKLSVSSASSSSSCKSHVNTSSNHSSSEQQKSYIESVSDASTFRDVKSISMSEIASLVFTSGKDEPNDKSVSSGKTTKDEFANTRSSAKKCDSVSASPVVDLKENVNESINKILLSAKAAKGESSAQSSTVKNAPESKNDKPDEPEMCESPTSRKTDKSTKSNSTPQGKIKNSNKTSKNRPKSNSKSSSVPSLSDITTVSSQSLNTDSVMKQISGSEDSSKGEN